MSFVLTKCFLEKLSLISFVDDDLTGIFFDCEGRKILLEYDETTDHWNMTESRIPGSKGELYSNRIYEGNMIKEKFCFFGFEIQIILNHFLGSKLKIYEIDPFSLCETVLKLEKLMSKFILPSYLVRNHKNKMEEIAMLRTPKNCTEIMIKLQEYEKRKIKVDELRLSKWLENSPPEYYPEIIQNFITKNYGIFDNLIFKVSNKTMLGSKEIKRRLEEYNNDNIKMNKGVSMELFDLISGEIEPGNFLEFPEELRENTVDYKRTRKGIEIVVILDGVIITVNVRGSLNGELLEWEEMNKIKNISELKNYMKNYYRSRYKV